MAASEPAGRKLAKPLVWMAAAVAGILLALAAWAPSLLAPRTFISILAVCAIAGVLWYRKGGPNLYWQAVALTVGYVGALALALIFGTSDFPDWMKANAAAVQAAVAVIALLYLAQQTRIVERQADLFARQLALEEQRDATKFVVEHAVLLDSGTLHVTVLNKGMRGSDVETITVTAMQGNGVPFRRITNLAPLADEPGDPALERYVREGTRRSMLVEFPDWPSNAVYPLSITVKVTPVLGPAAEYPFTQMG